MPIPMSQKLMYAARKAYQVSATGPVPAYAPGSQEATDDAQIPWLPASQNGFASGNDLMNAGYVGETATEVIVAFRGTLPLSLSSPDKRQAILDWLNDANAILVPFDASPGLVHKGFLDALNTLWAAIGPAVNAASAANPLKPILRDRPQQGRRRGQSGCIAHQGGFAECVDHRHDHRSRATGRWLVSSVLRSDNRP